MSDEQFEERLVESQEVIVRVCQKTNLGYAIGVSAKWKGVWLDGCHFYFSENPFKEGEILVLEMYQPKTHYSRPSRFELKKKTT